MTAYYNEHDPFAAQWLRNLMEVDAIPKGFVDERSIVEVNPSDLVGYVQHHFFAGIGGWPLALRIAGWGDGTPVTTGSPPCQPFSQAGKRKGTADERHLWPEFRRLIAECRPSTVFGEQVASKPGRQWLAGVFADLEELGYAVAGADLCAAGVGAPHIRQRLFWVADESGTGLEGRTIEPTRQEREAAERSGCVGGMANARHDMQSRPRQGRGPEEAERTQSSIDSKSSGMAIGLANSESARRGMVGASNERASNREIDAPADSGGGRAQWLVHPEVNGRHERRPESDRRNSCAAGNANGMADANIAKLQRITPAWEQSLQQWRDAIVIPCRDGRARRISAQPGDEPLADGIPRDLGRRFPELRSVAKSARSNRVGRLRGYGNAIVAPMAAVFIRAFLEATQ